MKSRFAGPLGLLLASAFALFATPTFAQSKLLEPFHFALNWFAVGDHAAYWVALDKGYFKERGLDVTLETSKGSADSIGKVDTGRDDAGLADTVPVLSAIARGAKIKMVGMVFDKTPLNVFSRKDEPIHTPQELVGKTIGAPPGDGQRQAWPAFAKANGIDPNAVTWVNVEPSAKVAALAGKRVDAVGDYLTGLPFYEKAMGKGSVVEMPWANFHFDMYSMSIIASDKTMKERPEALRKFLEAAYMGWRDVMLDPQGSLKIFKKHVPEIDLSIIEPNMMIGLSLMRTERYAEHGIGWIDEKKMCRSVDIVNTYMSLPNKVECHDVYTDAFMPKVTMPLSVLK